MSVMYGFGYEVLLALLLAVVLLVGVPLSVILRRSGLGWWMILPVVAFSSLSVLVLAVIFSTVVTVRPLSDGAFAPLPEPLKISGTMTPAGGTASRPGMHRETLNVDTKITRIRVENLT